MKTKNNYSRSRSVSLRMRRPLATACACCGAIGLLVGCASTPESHVVSAPPPPAPTRSVTTTTVTTTPDTMPAVAVANPAHVAVTTTTPGVTYVTQAPPALQSEVVLAQPSSQSVWLAGYWTWRDNAYQWMAGHWEVPPREGSEWVAPRWEQQGNAYRFFEGYWT